MADAALRNEIGLFGPIWHITRRELGAYFNTAIGYVFLFMFMLLIRYLYVESNGGIFVEGVAEMRGFFGHMPLLFLIYVPAVSMRLWAEERKLGTLELLMTFPVRPWQAVAGKFLAGMIFIAVTMILTFDLPISLYLMRGTGAGPDFGPIIGGYLGVMVLGMVYLSIGAFASSLTGDQIVAFVISLTLNFFVFLLAFPDFLLLLKDLISTRVAEMVQQFGVIYHFESICRGVVDSRDVLYAVSVTGFFLFLNVLVIERRR